MSAPGGPADHTGPPEGLPMNAPTEVKQVYVYLRRHGAVSRPRLLELRVASTSELETALEWLEQRQMVDVMQRDRDGADVFVPSFGPHRDQTPWGDG